jgi:tetratricopeptide (TPR) repeat protein
MRVRFRLAKALVLLVVAAGIACVIAGRSNWFDLALLLTFLSAIPVAIFFSWIDGRRRRRLDGYLAELHAAVDLPYLRALHDDVVDHWTHKRASQERDAWTTLLAANDGYLHMLAGKWREASRAFASIANTPGLPMPFWFSVRNNLAWSKTQAGDVDAAVAIASALRDDPEVAASPYHRVVADGTLGVALTRAGRHGDALTRLAAAESSEGPPLFRASYAFHLAEAQRGLERIDDAEASYRRAVELAHDSEWGERAERALAELHEARPYR